MLKVIEDRVIISELMLFYHLILFLKQFITYYPVKLSRHTFYQELLLRHGHVNVLFFNSVFNLLNKLIISFELTLTIKTYVKYE